MNRMYRSLTKPQPSTTLWGFLSQALFLTIIHIRYQRIYKNGMNTNRTSLCYFFLRIYQSLFLIDKKILNRDCTITCQLWRKSSTIFLILKYFTPIINKEKNCSLFLITYSATFMRIDKDFFSEWEWIQIFGFQASRSEREK